MKKALRSSHTLVPDELSRSSAPGWVIEAVPVNGEFRLTSVGRTVRARHVSSVHGEDMLVVYLPESPTHLRERYLRHARRFSHASTTADAVRNMGA